MNGINFTNASDVYFGGSLVRYVYYGSKLIWDAKKPITPSVSMAGWTYGSTASNPSVSGNTGGASVTYTYKVNGAADSTYTSTKPSNAGTYVVRAVIAETTRYYGATATNTFTIAARPINITAGSNSKTYDKSALTYNSASAESSGTNRGLVSGHSMTSCTVSGTITNVGSTNNVPSSAVIKSGSTDVTSNYNINYVNGTLTVTPRTVTLSWGTLTWTYDGSTHSTTCTAGNLCSGDSCTVTLSGNSVGPNINVGGTVVTATGLSNSNYTLPSSRTATLIINVRSVTYTATNESWTYNGSSHSASNTATLTSGSLVSGHTATFSCSGSVGPNVGSSTKTLSSVTIKNSGGTDVSSNYSITKVNNSLYINRANTASASASNKTYNGTTESNGTSQTGVTGSNVSWSGTTSATNAGSYKAYATPTSNYAWSDGTYALKTISWTMSRRGQNPPTLNSSSVTYPSTASASVKTAGTIVGGTATCPGTLTWSNQSRSSIGSLTATAYYAATTTNFSASSASAGVTVQVSKYTPTVTLSATNRVYNGSALYASATVSQPSGGVTPKGTIYYGTSSGATTYSVTYSGSAVNLSSVSVTNYNNGSGNSSTVYAYFVPDSSCNGVYNQSGNTSRTLTITGKANQSAPTATGATTTYPTTATATASGGGGQGSIEWSNGNTQTSVGSKTTKARWSGNGNYNASDWSNEVTLTVYATSTITLNNTSSTYAITIVYKAYYNGGYHENSNIYVSPNKSSNITIGVSGSWHLYFSNAYIIKQSSGVRTAVSVTDNIGSRGDATIKANVSNTSITLRLA